MKQSSILNYALIKKIISVVVYTFDTAALFDCERNAEEWSFLFHLLRSLFAGRDESVHGVCFIEGSGDSRFHDAI
jgi:hypothetical protein